MSVNYPKLYSYLVAQIDDTLQQIAAYAMKPTGISPELFEVGEKLRSALLSAEDMYLDDAEDE